MKTLPLLALALGLSALPLISCERPMPPPGESGPAAEAARSYSTRGLVRALPNPDQPGSSLQIRHEAVPDFHDMDGERVGMEGMTMPFPAEPSLLEGVAVGDKVSFDFEVNWTGNPPLRITRLDVLPTDTVLEFETPH